MKMPIVCALLSATLLAMPLAAAPISEGEAERMVAGLERPSADTDLDAARMPAKALAFMHLEEGDRVLDVFSGGGYFAELIARAVGPDGFVVAHNPAGFGEGEMLRQMLAQRGYGEARLPNVATMNRDFTGLYLAPGSFDNVVFHLVYHDLYFESEEFRLPRADPHFVLAQIHQSLRPGGLVTVIDHLGNGSDPRAEAEAVHRINPDTVLADFQQAGFALVEQVSYFENPEDDPSKNVFDPAVRGNTDRFAMRFKKVGDPNSEEAVGGVGGGDEGDDDMARSRCNDQAPQRLLGEVLNDAVRASAASMAGTDTIRAYATGSMLTQDFRPERLNIEYDPKTRKIVAFSCG